MKDFYCNICDNSFDSWGTSNQGLDLHLTEVHGRNPNADNGKATAPKLGQSKSLKPIDDRPETNRFQNMIRSGREFENEVENALKELGFFTTRPKKPNGKRVEGDGQILDVLAWKTHKHTYPFSCKKQDFGGTAEDKILKEAVDLQSLMDCKRGEFDRAFIVLSGAGFSDSLIKFLSGSLMPQYVRIPNVDFLWYGFPFRSLGNMKRFNEVVEKLE